MEALFTGMGDWFAAMMLLMGVPAMILFALMAGIGVVLLTFLYRVYIACASYFRQMCQFGFFDKSANFGFSTNVGVLETSPTLLCSSSLFADLVAFPAVLAVEGRGFVELFLGYQSFGQ